MAVFQRILDNNERSNQNHGFPLIEKSTEGYLKEMYQDSMSPYIC